MLVLAIVVVFEADSQPNISAEEKRAFVEIYFGQKEYREALINELWLADQLQDSISVRGILKAHLQGGQIDHNLRTLKVSSDRVDRLNAAFDQLVDAYILSKCYDFHLSIQKYRYIEDLFNSDINFQRSLRIEVANYIKSKVK